MDANDQLYVPAALPPGVKRPEATDLDLVWTLSEKNTHLLAIPEIKPRIFQPITY